MTTSDVPDPAPRSATLLESVDHTRSSLLDAVRTGATAYAAVWVVTFLLTGTALLAASTDDDVPWSWYLTTPGQAVAMSSHATFDYTTTVNFDDEFDDEFSEDGEDFGEEGDELPPSEVDEDSMIAGEITSSSQFTTISLTVLGLMIAALWLASRRAERRRPTPSRRAVLAASTVTGVTFAVLTWAVAFTARVRIDGDFGHAGTLSILFWASVLGTAVALVARRPVARRRAVSRLPAELRASVRGVAVYLAVFVALLVPAAAIYAIANGEAEAILTFPLAILNIGVYAITFGQLAGVEVPGLAFGDDSGATFIWLFSDDVDRILLVLIPLAIASLAVAVAVLARLSADRPRTSRDSFWLVSTFAGAGALLTALGIVTTTSSTFGSGLGGSGGIFAISLSPVPWLFLVMAAWGVVTEIAVRTVGRPLAELVPGKVLDRLTGS